MNYFYSLASSYTSNNINNIPNPSPKTHELSKYDKAIKTFKDNMKGFNEDLKSLEQEYQEGFHRNVQKIIAENYPSYVANKKNKH